MAVTKQGRLHWIRRHRRIAMCTALLISAIAIADVFLMEFLRSKAFEDAKRETANLSFVLAQQLDREFSAAKSLAADTADLLQSSKPTSIDDLEDIASQPATQAFLSGKATGMAGIGNIAVIGSNGRVFVRSRGPSGAASPNLADRDYIAEFAQKPNLKNLISRPYKARTTGIWATSYAQPLRNAANVYLGSVVVAIELNTLEELFSRIAIGRGGSIALSRADGVLLARYPRLEDALGSSYADRPLFKDLISNGTPGVLRQISRIDGVDRLLAIDQARNFPIAITVSESVQDILEGFKPHRDGLLIAGLIACLVVLASGIILARHSERLTQTLLQLEYATERERAQAALRAEHNRFLAAINNMGQGLVMFDEKAKLVACNPHYAELYKLPAHLTMPGTARSEILKYRASVGTDREGESRFLAVASAEQRSDTHRLRDGRMVAVVHRAMVNGGWVSTHEDVTERRRTEEKIVHMAGHDALTDLPNRVQFREKLEVDLSSADITPMALLYIDLDRFKVINDSLGHPVGDALIQSVAERLSRAIETGDFVARVGGDEFVVIHAMIDRALDVMILAERIIESLAAPYEIDGRHLVIGATIGVAIAPLHAQGPDDLIRRADLALYVAKREKRGAARMFTMELEADYVARRDLDRELRQALIRGEFELFYQPIVALGTSTITAFEALLRWKHPTRQILSPIDFISVVEETGLIVPVGEWVLKQACADAANWPSNIKVAVNVSAVQFRSAGLISSVREALRQSKLPPSRLELELTETVMLDDSDNFAEVFSELRSLGIKIAMDDFGTGHSSLSYLSLFSFDKLKIDQCFIRDLGRNEHCTAIVSAAVSLAQQLGISTVAEGIETPSQLLRVVAAGCTEGQGYLFGRPEPAYNLSFTATRHDAVA